jgi:hypothetical protein
MTSIRLTTLLTMLAASAFAQTFRGDMSGIITDSSGAAVANAKVQVEDPATGLARSTLAGGSGEYLVAELPVGRYVLTVSMPGFEVKKIENIEIAVAKTTNINVTLGVATQQNIVEVKASAALLETSSSSLVANVDDKSVQEMPMNGRDFTQMVKLAPGSTPISTSINGMRTNGKNFQIDGADNNDG